ncbi:MAG: prenyltransferase [Candidatus Zixiibacteriota bacterium]
MLRKDKLKNIIDPKKELANSAEKLVSDKRPRRFMNNPIVRTIMKILDAFALFRPLLLICVWMPAILGFWSSRIPPDNSLGAVAPGNREGMAILFLTMTLLGGSVFIINQIFDIKADKIGGKHLPLAEGLISKQYAWAMYIITSLFALFFAFTWNLPVGLLTLTGVILGIIYSHPKFSLKNKPLGGLILNGIGHGALIFIIGYFWSERYDMQAIWASLPYLFAYASVYILTTIPDIEADRETDKITIAVKMGVKNSIIMANVILLIAIGTALIVSQPPIFLTGFISLPFFVYALKNHSTVISANKVAISALAILTSLFYPWFFFVFVILVTIVYFYNKLRYRVSYP